MIIRGGENIYPREIEEFLYTHPKIDDVQVIGVPDGKYGEELWPGSSSARGRPRRRRRFRRVLQGQDRPLQDPALREVRHGVPDDGHRKIQKFKMREAAIKELGLEKAAQVKMA